jgi:outer membrane protein
MKSNAVLFFFCLTIMAGGPCFASPDTVGVGTNTLSLRQALETAFKKHPRIIAADLQILISKQTLREARSSYFPTINADATGVGTPTEHNQIISAGTLQVSSTYDREADGISINQLITDFGRTANLVASS